MQTLVLFGFILAMAGLAYRLVYPVMAGDDLKRLVAGDVVLMAIVFAVVGWHYYGTDVRFDFFLFEASWFWASLICLCVAEALLLPAYCRRFNLFK